MSDKDDLTIAWSQDKHAEMVEHIQALMGFAQQRLIILSISGQNRICPEIEPCDAETLTGKFLIPASRLTTLTHFI